MMYKRGNVYLVQEGHGHGSEIKKTRPWVLVGANPISRARSTVVAIPLSTQAKPIPHLTVEVLLNNRKSCVVLDQIRAVDKSRLIQQEGVLTRHEMDSIDAGLRAVLSL